MTIPKIASSNTQPIRKRSRFMINEENNRILEYIRAGCSHKQIIQFIGISERQYWRRIKQIQLKDIDLLLAKQTQESRAFLHQRTLDKIQLYLQGAINMASNKNLKPADRIAAYNLARQLAADEYSLEVHGPSSFLTPQLNDKLYRGNRETALLLREAIADTHPSEQQSDPSKAEEQTQQDTNRVF